MKKFYILTILCFLLFYPLAGQAQLQSQTTPEYSGPSAKFDRTIDDYRAQQSQKRIEYTRADDVLRAMQNDRGFETNTARRNVIIQRELTRRSYEARQQRINE